MTNTNLPTTTSKKRETLLKKINNDLINANNKSLNNLTTSILRFGNLADQLNTAFKKADNLQVKALATNTTMAKFIKQNNEILYKMRGDFFENAEELLENFSEGIRQDSDNLVELTNVMAITGQSTELMRSVMANLLVVNKNNIGVIDRLSKVNLETSNKYIVSNQKLISVLDALRGVIRDSSLVAGAPEAIAKFGQELAGRLGGKGLDEIPKIVSLLQSSDLLGTRQVLGIQEAVAQFREGNLSTEAMIQSLQMGFSKVESMLENVNGTLSQEVRESILDQLSGGNKDVLIALRNVLSVMNSQENISDELRRTSEDAYKNQQTIEGLARDFYNRSLQEVYPMLLNVLPTLYRISTGAGVAGAALGSLGGIFPRLGAGLAAGGIGGPIAAIVVGGLAALLPEILGAFKTPTDTDKRTLEVQKRIEENTRRAIQDKPQNSVGGTFNSVMTRYLVDSRISVERMQKERETKLAEQTIVLKKILEAFKESKNRAPSTPPGVVR